MLELFFRSIHTAKCRFAGHSKWANIKHTKAQKDAKKSTIFTKLSRQIRLAVQEGGENPMLNSQLRSVVEEALRRNMPMATIQNNIKASQRSKSDLKEYILEIRFKQKIFAICKLYTDNFPATKMDLATILRKSGASFVDSKHLFDDFGLIEATLSASLENNLQLEERATNDAIECGAEDVDVGDISSRYVRFICCPRNLTSIRKALEDRGYIIESTEHIFTAKNAVKPSSDELDAYKTFVERMHNVSGLENIFDNINVE